MTQDENWRAGFDKMPVTGHCDAGCGKPATTWFGLTSCASCGDSACVNVLQDSYDREGERPDFGPRRVPDPPDLATLQQHNLWQGWRIVEQAREANQYLDRIRGLEDAVRDNHEWHQNYDEHGGYPGSALEQTNRAALGLPPKDPT
jgi:hypothetical protein